MGNFKFNACKAAIARWGIASGVFTLTGVCMAYTVVSVCLIQFFAPQCSGSGLPENKTYINGGSVPGFFTKRTLAVRVATTILTNAAGFPVGREGPTVTIGSNLAYLVSKRLATPYVKGQVDVSSPAPALVVDESRLEHATRIACTVGGACAMSCIFNAPFGGLLYMFEEITSVSWPVELTFRVFVATMCCALISVGLCNVIQADITEFVIYAEQPQIKKWKSMDIPIFILLSAALGVITSWHTSGMLAMRKWRQRFWKRFFRQPQWASAAKIVETVLYGGVCAILFSCAALMDTCTKKGESGLHYVEFNCDAGEYNQVASLLVASSHSSVKLLFSGTNGGEIRAFSSLVAFLTYYILNVGLSGLPAPGGAFTATMLLGGLFGRAVGELCREIGIAHSVSGVYAVVGSAAMLCGFKQMTLAAVIITIECVNDLSLAPVVMLGVTVAISVNWRLNRRGHDEAQIFLRKLPFLEGEAPHELDQCTAESLCESVPEEHVLPPQCPARIVRSVLAADRAYFPIRDPDRGSGPYLGIVHREHLEAALRTASPDVSLSPRSLAFAADREQMSDPKLSLRRIMDPTPLTIVEDMPAPRLYALFANAGERAVCVVRKTGEPCGLISREGLVDAARQAVEEAEQSAAAARAIGTA